VTVHKLAYFDTTLRGHGVKVRAQVVVHGFSDRPPAFTPPGIEMDVPLR
jgi:hypothetical protein